MRSWDDLPFQKRSHSVDNNKFVENAAKDLTDYARNINAQYLLSNGVKGKVSTTNNHQRLRNENTSLHESRPHNANFFRRVLLQNAHKKTLRSTKEMLTYFPNTVQKNKVKYLLYK